MYVWLIITVPHLVDHVQGALEDGIKDLRYLTGDVSPQLVDNGCHGAEDLRLTGSGNIALVVNEDGVQQRWNKVLPYLEKQWDQHPTTDGGKNTISCYRNSTSWRPSLTGMLQKCAHICEKNDWSLLADTL